MNQLHDSNTAENSFDTHAYIRTDIRKWARTANVTKPDLRLSLRSIAEGALLWIIGIGVGAAIGGWAGRIVGWILILTALVRLQYLFHESAHRSVFRRKWLNDLFGAVLGSLALVPHAAYRAQHLEHHRLTRVERNEIHDPEGFYDEVTTRFGYLATILLGGSYLSVWYTWQVIKCVSCRPVSWLPSAKRVGEMRRWGTMSIAGSAALVFTLTNLGLAHEMLMWWLIPMLIFLSTLFTTLGFYEHANVPRNTPILFASATLHSNKAFCWLTMNSICHRAHHVLPAALSHHLASVEKEIQRALTEHGAADQAPVYSGIISFHIALWRRLPWFRSTPQTTITRSKVEPADEHRRKPSEVDQR